jgi:hypothetical protein
LCHPPVRTTNSRDVQVFQLEGSDSRRELDAQELVCDGRLRIHKTCILREPDVNCRPPLAPIGRHGTCVHEAGTSPLVFYKCEQLHARSEACKGLGKAGLKGGAEVEDPVVIAAGIEAVSAGGAARAGPLDRLDRQRVLCWQTVRLGGSIRTVHDLGDCGGPCREVGRLHKEFVQRAGVQTNATGASSKADDGICHSELAIRYRQGNLGDEPETLKLDADLMSRNPSWSGVGRTAGAAQAVLVRAYRIS